MRQRALHNNNQEWNFSWGDLQQQQEKYNLSLSLFLSLS